MKHLTIKLKFNEIYKRTIFVETREWGDIGYKI